MARKPKTAESGENDRDKAVRTKLEKLRDEFETLKERRIETETTRRDLEQRLKELKAKAEQTYGTSDLDELKALLEQRRQENEKMVAEYEAHIEGIKEQLAEIEKNAQGQDQ